MTWGGGLQNISAGLVGTAIFVEKCSEKCTAVYDKRFWRGL